MPLAFLQPVFLDETVHYHPQQIGGIMDVHSPERGIPNLDEVQIALIGLENQPDELMRFRKQWYELYAGNWQWRMVDLGNLIISEQDSDTNYAIKELVAFLVKRKIIPIFVGGSQRFTYGLYRGFDLLEQMVNMVSIDARFDFTHGGELFSDHSYMSQILSVPPTNLHDFTNIGYQSYYVAQEELDLMDKMLFEVHRLGNVSNDISMAEPALRDADLVSLDMSSVQAKDINVENGYVNGFSNREICSLARYAGISNNVQVFGVFDIPATALAMQLTAQVVWYFCEGCNFRIPELPNTDNANYIKHIVLVDDYEIIFYQSRLTNRWWLKAGEDPKSNSNHFPIGLIPCNPSEYEQAIQGNIPDRWWKSFRKYMM
ncbi:MAG: formimidoylglutamase [Capnocytophaga sp.]|nr:formimidoylglutamase [Capnocytophaga sp.]